MKSRIHFGDCAARITIAALLLACAAFASEALPHVLATESRTFHAEEKSSSDLRTEPAAPRASMPFRVGERLDYRVAWSSFDDASAVQLSVPESRNLFGWQTWHFQATIHTVHSVRTLFPVDDQFDSYTDTSTLECRQFEMYRNELGKSTAKVYDLIHPGQQPRAPAPAVIVSPGTRDPLGMLFTLRAVDWQWTPEVRIPIYDGHDLYEMHAHIEAVSDSVQVDAGTFTASRISIQLFKNGTEDASVRFTIWLANDTARTPVQFAAELPFGDLRVQLTDLKLGDTRAE